MESRIQISPLIWDSDFFQKRIGKVVVSTMDEWEKLNEIVCSTLPYDLIYIFSKEGLPSSVPTAKLVDTKVIYAKFKLLGCADCCPNIFQYRKQVPDLFLYNLALTSGHCSRYKLDSNFPRDSYEKLYMRWIENSVNGKIADIVLCYREQGDTLGMITLKVSNDNGTIGLIAVDESSQGHGVGTELLRAVENWFYSKGGRSIEVATQKANQRACRFYEKQGYSPVSMTDIYHLWL